MKCDNIDFIFFYFKFLGVDFRFFGGLVIILVFFFEDLICF